MTTHERKLLRRQVNFKLNNLANIESKKNDFLNSSQIITERQMMYLTISKHFRREDNRHRPRNLPFAIDKTCLPHVNVSLVNRLYRSADATLKSPDLKKVIMAHSYRTATPFYTNPELTIDRGKMTNYSFHVGTILHTPRYIEFLKSTPEYASTVKKKQSPESEKPRKYSTSESYSSSTISTMESDSSSSSSESSSKPSTIVSQSKSTNTSLSSKQKSKASQLKSPVNDENVTIPSRSSTRSSRKSSFKLIDEQVYSGDFSTKFLGEPGDLSKYSDDFEDNIAKSSSEISSSKKIMERETTIMLEDPFEKREVSSDSLEIHGLPCENDQIDGEIEPTFPISDNEKEFVELKKEEDSLDITTEDVRRGSTHSIKSPTLEIRDIDHGLLRKDFEDFFDSRMLDKTDLDLLIRYFETVDKYKHLNPDYINEFGMFLAKNNSPNFEEFYKLVSLHQAKNFSAEDSIYINSLIKNYEIKCAEELLQPLIDTIINEDKTDDEVDSDDDDANEQINKNIYNTMKRVFDIDELMENYDIEIDANVDEVNVDISGENTKELDNKVTEKEDQIDSNGDVENENEMVVKDDDDEKEVEIENNIDRENKDDSEDNDEIENNVDIEDKDEIENNVDIEDKDEIENNVDSEDKDEIENNVDSEDKDEIENHVDSEDKDESENRTDNETEDYSTKEFADAFKTLYRNSITAMNDEDMVNLRKLISEYEKSEEVIEGNNEFIKKFKDLFMTEKDKMDVNDFQSLRMLIDHGTEDCDDFKHKQFKELIDNYHGTMSESDIEKAKLIIATEELYLENATSDSEIYNEDEDTETMMAFRNLFRSSVGEISKGDLLEIQRIINEA